MAIGEGLYRGRPDARAALLVGNIEAAIAALSPRSEIVAMLREGRTADAITSLERTDLPKWRSVAACREAYQKAMGARS